jgi:uncharacterized membrane protein (GlpM family)
MSYDNLSSVSQNGLKFYQQLTGEERRIHFIFDDFYFCRSRVIGLDMTENRIFTLCCMITWVVFLRMVWNFISNLTVKRGGSLSYLTIFTFAVPELFSVSQNGLKFYQQLTCAERRIHFIFDDFHFCHSRVIGLDMTENMIFTLCHMISCVVFLRMFWNFITSLPVKRGGSLSFFTIFTFAIPELLDLIWRKIGFLPAMSYDNLSSVSQNVLKFYLLLIDEERRIPFIFGRNNQ